MYIGIARNTQVVCMDPIVFITPLNLHDIDLAVVSSITRICGWCLALTALPWGGLETCRKAQPAWHYEGHTAVVGSAKSDSLNFWKPLTLFPDVCAETATHT